MSTIESKRYARISRLCTILEVQQMGRAINPRLVRRLGRTLIANGSTSAEIKRISRYACKRHAQPK